MSRIHGKNAKVLIYGPEKETVTGLVIAPEPIEVDVGSPSIDFIEKLEGLQDWSGEFTGYLY